MPNFIGQRVDQFEVLERIGSGGMGEVYLARDVHLDRPTALKFLPEDLADDGVARSRLLREARAAAALDHPSICRVYAIGEHDRQLYLALEYISGRTLQNVLRSGLMPIQRCVQVTAEICDALGEAHAKGIVHRDLKPSNLMFSDQGHVKVLDFGLAKRHELAADSDVPLTETGMAIGTIPYMSPEQLNGRRLDGRSDLFSLGIMLYEMLTGVHPFGRQVNMETAMAILNKDAPPMHRVGEKIPDRLKRLVDRLLAKTAADRFVAAAEVRDVLLDTPDLEEMTDDPLHEARTRATARPLDPVSDPAGETRAVASPATGVVAPGSIAVLPFTRLSPDPEDEFFGDGLADEITTALAKLRPIKVVARTSAFAFKGRNEDVRVIGRELGADALLQGSIRRAGSRVRIGVQLVSAADGGHLWSERFDRELVDVFALQDEISQKVVAILRLQLGSGSVRAMAVPRAASMEAYQHYLQARHSVRTHTAEGMRQALRSYQDALELDPEYAPALAGSAEATITQIFFSVLSPAEGYPRAKELVTRALELDPDVDNARGVLSSIQSNWEWDFEAAEEQLQTGIERIPNYAAGHYTLSVLLSNLGRHDEAVESAQEAVRLDPLNSTVVGQVGFSLHYAGRNKEAEAHFRSAVSHHPASAMIALGLAVVLRDQGRFVEAVREVESAPPMIGGLAEATLATCYPALGREQEARAILAGFEQAATEELPLAYVRAAIHGALGERERALDMLELSAESREPMVLTVANVGSFRELATEERFQALRRRIGI